MYLGTVDINVDVEDVLDEIPDGDIERYLAAHGREPKETPTFAASEKEFMQFVYDYVKSDLKVRSVEYSEQEFADALSDLAKKWFYLLYRSHD